MQIYAEYARFQIRFVGRRDRVDEGYIFRRLFGNDVERVVYGDDAYEQVFLIRRREWTKGRIWKACSQRLPCRSGYPRTRNCPA